MASSIMSVGLQGMKGHTVRVEANVRADKEQCVIIGLPDASIKESKERVLSCLHTLDFDIEMKKITIHLSPADVRKSGTGFDCAMQLSTNCWTRALVTPAFTTLCLFAYISYPILFMYAGKLYFTRYFWL